MDLILKQTIYKLIWYFIIRNILERIGDDEIEVLRFTENIEKMKKYKKYKIQTNIIKNYSYWICMVPLIFNKQLKIIILVERIFF